ncbi:MAG: indole-3-glycerol phosphate synthase TrpC [Actinomycetota bacterium]
MSILAKIVAHKRREIEDKKQRASAEALMLRANFIAPARDFKDALGGPNLSLIAEIKKASPSRGVLSKDMEPGVLAVSYELAGADALSVLTDREFFDGGLDDLVTARAVTDLPVMRKDFIIDEYQIYEAKAYGADAVLLIAGLLDAQTLNSFLALCDAIDIHALVETHTEEDVSKAVSAGAGIIGVNNRDLNTFETDVAATERLLPGLPEGILKVSESGIFGRGEAGRVRAAGADAVLVGESLIRADNMQALIDDIKQAVVSG